MVILAFELPIDNTWFSAETENIKNIKKIVL